MPTNRLVIHRGFTLIELIVVLALLGVIAAALLASINPLSQLQKTNDTRRKTDLEAIQHALELYYQDKNSYPTSSASYQIMNGAAAVAWGTSWSPYMSTLPKDTSAATTYVYYSPGGANANQSYYLYAHLQRGGQDAQACNKTGTDCPNVPAANLCGGVSCNYGVSSPNVSP